MRGGEVVNTMENFNDFLDKYLHDNLENHSGEFDVTLPDQMDDLLDFLDQGAGESQKLEEQIQIESSQSQSQIERQREEPEKVDIEVEVDGKKETVTIVRLDENGNNDTTEDNEIAELVKKKRAAKVAEQLQVTLKKRGRRSKEFEVKLEKQIEMTEKYETLGKLVKELVDNDEDISKDIIEKMVRDTMI